MVRAFSHLGERAAVFDRHHLAELRADTSSSRRGSARRAREPVKRACRVISRCSRSRVVARHVVEHLDAAVRLEIVDVVIDALADLFLRRHRLELDHRHVAAASRRCRPRRARRRCRPTCRPRSCGRSGRARRRCRRSCIRSNGRRRLRSRRWRRNCARRSARRRRRGNSTRPRSRRRARCCRR